MAPCKGNQRALSKHGNNTLQIAQHVANSVVKFFSVQKLLCLSGRHRSSVDMTLKLID